MNEPNDPNHLNDPNVRVIDASFKMPGVLPLPKDDYLAAHIPGAVFFDVDAVSDHSNPLPHMFPSAEQFGRDVGALGIGNDDTVVLYDSGGWVAAPRVWWMFLSFGKEVRILNGAHTASALASYSAGLDTVQAMIDDPVVSKYLRTLMFDEIVPCVPLPDAERKAYANTIMERFANPYIRHELISIALNSVSKWQVRVLPTVKDFAKAQGKAPKLLSFSLAALLNFYSGSYTDKGEYVGSRAGQSYPIKDNAEVLTVLAEAWRTWSSSKDTAALVRSVLGDARLWGEDLNAVPGLSEQAAAALARIKAVGVKQALEELL